MGVFIPSTPGGFISVSDSTALATELSANGLPPGTKVWNLGVGAYFTLTDSTASLSPDVVVAVLGTTGVRWIKDVAATGIVTTVVAGNGIAVNASDPNNPIVSNYDDYDGWFKTVVDLMHAQVPSLTNFREMKIGQYPIGAATGATVSTDDALVAGGGVGNPAGGGKLFGASLTTIPKTGRWAIAFRGNLKTSTAGHFNYLGLLTSAFNHELGGVATFSTSDATHYVLYTFAGTEKKTVSSVVVDDAYHTFVITFDATTLKLFIDGTQAATLVDLGGTADENAYIGLQGTVALEAKAARCAYGYVAP